MTVIIRQTKIKNNSVRKHIESGEPSHSDDVGDKSLGVVAPDRGDGEHEQRRLKCRENERRQGEAATNGNEIGKSRNERLYSGHEDDGNLFE